jgi:hypothetical protein
MNHILALLVPAVGAIAAAFVLYWFFVHRRARHSPEKPDPAILTLTADDRAFTVTDSRKVKSLDVRWQDVRQVTLIRTDTGPFDDTIFYHVVHQGGDITLPAGANNIQAFREQIAGQEGFDQTAHAAALASTANNIFVRILTA